MPIVVHNLSLGLDEPKSLLASLAARKLGLGEGLLRELSVLRRNFDARPRHMRWVYSVVVSCDDEASALNRSGADVRPYAPPADPHVEPGSETLDHPPVVVGTGPAGLFAALLLAEQGYRPIVIERGGPVDQRDSDCHTYIEDRVLNPESNLLFGEGGAGTYSDGKLYTRTHSGLAGWVVRTLGQAAGDPGLAVRGRPHLGSDRLPAICKLLRARITELGGHVHFGTRLDTLTIDSGRVANLELSGGVEVASSAILLAIGHSARDTYRMLAEAGVALSARAFQMGLRIEHPQELIDRAQLGPLADRPELTPSDYHLVARKAAGPSTGSGLRRDVYSFCMCPGGRVLPANHQPQTICTNGGSHYARDSGFANSALVATIDPETFANDPLMGLAMQEGVERMCFQAAGGDYALGAQRVADFLTGRLSEGEIATSSLTGVQPCDFTELLPEAIIDGLQNALPVLGRRIKGFDGPDAVLLGPETRASGPVRIDRDRETRTSVAADNLYPIGEGAGYAGGIVSAAVDGLRSAQALITRYAPPHR